MGITQKIANLIVPYKRKPNPKGTGFTNTFNPSGTTSVLSLPAYRNHLTDIFSTRVSSDSRTLLKDLVKYDSDVSATLHAYMTTANTQPRFFVYDAEGNLDREGQKILQQLLMMLTKRNDYSTGFQITSSLRKIAEDLRYMIMLRGACSGELIFDKFLYPNEFRHIDTAFIEFFEIEPGIYKPQQRPPNASGTISLDIPNYFIQYYRQNPTEVYPESMFVSSINTIAARQQVINDLYRIMQKTGYPRIEATIVEEVLRKNAPAEMKQDETKMLKWLEARLDEIAGTLSDMRPDAAYVHFDAVEAKILNERGPGSALDVTSIINVLNSQNQASLKTMATIIGRGESGVNTASVEARIFSMAADSLNGPIADLFSEMFTFAIRLVGYAGHVECKFDPVELRPDTELEAQRVLKRSRLIEDLSYGLITDDEYHIQMYNRIRPDSVAEMSGTLFYSGTGVAVDTSSVSPNSDPLGRSLSPAGSESAKSNSVKKKK